MDKILNEKIGEIIGKEEYERLADKETRLYNNLKAVLPQEQCSDLEELVLTLQKVNADLMNCIDKYNAKARWDAFRESMLRMPYA